MILCTLSGGYDSAAALLWSLDRAPTTALFLDYDQPYVGQELNALRHVVGALDHPNFHGLIVRHVQLRMPQGTPWIPYRNLVIASVATNLAVCLGANTVVFGSKSAVYRPDDAISYMDSTRGFYRALSLLIMEYTEPHNRELVPKFELPLIGVSKRAVMERLVRAGVDLRQLWNCYRTDGVLDPCGVCEHCVITQPLITSVLEESR